MNATGRKKFSPRIYSELLLEILPRPIQTEAWSLCVWFNP